MPESAFYKRLESKGVNLGSIQARKYEAITDSKCSSTVGPNLLTRISRSVHRTRKGVGDTTHLDMDAVRDRS